LAWQCQSSPPASSRSECGWGLGGGGCVAAAARAQVAAPPAQRHTLVVPLPCQDDRGCSSTRLRLLAKQGRRDLPGCARGPQVRFSGWVQPR
jgi:hypothetical protein